MAKKHLSEDEIKYIISADSSKAQQAIHQLGKSTASLRREEKARRSALIEMEATGKKNTDQYRKLKEEIKNYSKQISDNEAQMRKLRSTLDTSAMSMNQLRRYAKELATELDNTSRAASPQQFNDLQKRLASVNLRMEELRTSSMKLRQNLIGEGTINVMMGNAMVRLGELVGNVARNITGMFSDVIAKGVELAEAADGITHAFQRIGSEDYLQGLREATKNTVDDVELMKAAVKANDFRIPLEDLGKYLAFAQLKAQQTGQSLDYMVDSIVTGLGRRSPLILDNLGLSAAEIGEKTKKTGNFMKAVASIVEGQLAAAGEKYVSAADRSVQRTVALTNAQKKLGDAFLPIKQGWEDMMMSLKFSIIDILKFLAEHYEGIRMVGKALGVLMGTTIAYTVGQRLSYLWGMRTVAASKLKAAAMAIENAMTELSVLRHAVLNKTMTRSIALQKAFNVVLKLNPWGAVLGAITLVLGALWLFNRRTDAAARAQKRINEVKRQAIERAAEEKTKIDLLVAAARDEKRSMDERRKAVAELNRIIPNYNAQLDETTGKYRENKKALDDYLKSLVHKYEIEGAKDMLAKLAKEAWLAKEELKKANAELNGAQTAQGGSTYTTSWGAVGNTKQDVVDRARSKVSGAQAKYNAAESEKQAFLKSYGQDLASDAVAGAKAEGAQGAKDTVGAALDNIKAKIERLKAERLTLKVGDTSGLKRIDRQIAALERRKASLEGNGTRSTVHKTHGVDKAQKGGFDNSRQQDLAKEDAAYNESGNVLKKALVDKKKSQEEYNVAMQMLEVAHAANVLNIEREYTRKAQQLHIADANERQRIILAQQANEQKANQAFQDKSMVTQQQYFDALKTLQDQGMTDEQKREADHVLQLSSLEAFYKARLAQARQYGEDEKALTEAYERARAEIIRKYEQQAEEERFQTRVRAGLVSQKEIFERELAQLKEKLAREGATEEEQQRAVANMTRQFEEDKLRLRQQYGIATQQEQFDAELAQLKQHLDAKMITEEEYEQAVAQMKMDKWKQSFDYYSNLFGTAIKQLQDAEMANVDAKYDAEIEAAQGNADQVEKLEKQKANEKLNIQKKYADVNFAIQASQIIVNTAVSVMKAFSELGPIGGAIAGALMSVAGTAQLAVANAERQKVKKMTLQGASSGSSATGARVATGLESGGSIDVEREQDGRLFKAKFEPDRRGYVDRPTVLVGEGPTGHSKEWVASNAALENPTVAPLIDVIDKAQRVGDIRTLDLRKVMMQRGLASGGFVSQPAASNAQPSATPTTVTISPSNATGEELLSLLRELREKGIPSFVALDEIEARQKIQQQYRMIAQKQ
jgi:membrane protein|nr:MAG TPA: tail tape measure protein [Caudoviricetes sp.]